MGDEVDVDGVGAAAGADLAHASARRRPRSPPRARLSAGSAARSVSTWKAPTRIRVAWTAITAAMPIATAVSDQTRPALAPANDAMTPSET